MQIKGLVWGTGQALLRSPRRRNASRDGLIKLDWVHCLQYTLNCFQDNVCGLCRCEPSNHIGSCSLHVVNERFEKRAKESEWNLGNILRSLWQIFHVTPAKREDFIQITGSDLYPFQFWQHKWVEDIKIVEQALEIWIHVNK